MYTIQFISRNKDNREVEGFKPRSENFAVDDVGRAKDRIQRKFSDFVNRGVNGEKSRMYVSVNERDDNKTRKALVHFLIDHEDYPLHNLESKLASIADKPENAKTHRWLFDFDSSLDEDLEYFLNLIPDDIPTEVHKTPHGYGIVVEHGVRLPKCFKLQ